MKDKMEISKEEAILLMNRYDKNKDGRVTLADLIREFIKL
jgi:Ca2+-binding EF-hand superfamily protein